MDRAESRWGSFGGFGGEGSEGDIEALRPLIVWTDNNRLGACRAFFLRRFKAHLRTGVRPGRCQRKRSTDLSFIRDGAFREPPAPLWPLWVVKRMRQASRKPQEPATEFLRTGQL